MTLRIGSILGSALLTLCFTAPLGCGDDDGPARVDSGPGVDSGRGVDSGPGVDAGGMTGYAFATIAPDCGPADGAALRLRLYLGGTGCTPDPESGNLDFYLFGAVLPIEAPETAIIGTDFSSDGTANENPPPGSLAPIRMAESGSVSFETYTVDVGASGTWTLTFAGGETMSGSFDATWCAPSTPLMCG